MFALPCRFSVIVAGQRANITGEAIGTWAVASDTDAAALGAALVRIRLLNPPESWEPPCSDGAIQHPKTGKRSKGTPAATGAVHPQPRGDGVETMS